MPQDPLAKSLSDLGVSQLELAVLLGVSGRSVSRWFIHGVPNACASAINAWLLLQRSGLPWRPGSLPLDRALRDIGAVTRAVEKRGGPRAPWVVKPDRLRACLGRHMMISYVLRPDGVLPLSYERTDIAAEIERDRPLLEDGVARIAAEIGDRARAA